MHAWSRYAFLTIVNDGITLWTIDKCEWKHGIQSESWSTFDRFFDRRVFTFLHLSQSASYLLERQSQKCAVTPIFTRFAFVEAQLTRHLFVCSRRVRCHSIENWTLCPLRYSCLRNLKRGTQTEAHSTDPKCPESISCPCRVKNRVYPLFRAFFSDLLQPSWSLFDFSRYLATMGEVKCLLGIKRRTWARGIVRQFTAESMLVSRWLLSHWWFLRKQDETVWPMSKWPWSNRPLFLIDTTEQLVWEEASSCTTIRLNCNLWNSTGAETTADHTDARSFIKLTVCSCIGSYAVEVNHDLHVVSTAICMLISEDCETIPDAQTISENSTISLLSIR